MNVQFIEYDEKPTFAVMPIETYKKLAEAIEDREDAAAFDNAMKEFTDGNNRTYPAQVVHDIANGANPLKTIREWKNISIERLASQLGVTKAHLLQIETGKRDMSVELLRKLVKALDVEADILI